LADRIRRLRTIPGVGPITALVEAAKLAPRQSHELAVIYEREKQKGNGNRATLAVARKMVAYLLAVDREQRDFNPC
jgi:transposase